MTDPSEIFTAIFYDAKGKKLGRCAGEVESPGCYNLGLMPHGAHHVEIVREKKEQYQLRYTLGPGNSINGFDDMEPLMTDTLLPCNLARSLKLRRHGHTCGKSYTPTYHSWQAMIARCRYVERDTNRKHAGRGIGMCERWQSFEAFLGDMGERPDGTTLDRIDNEGNYEPGNCQWATPRQQARNRRNCKLDFESAVEVAVARLRGEPLRSIAARYGISENMPNEIVKGRAWPDALARAKEIVSD